MLPQSSDAAAKASIEQDLENHGLPESPGGNGCFMAMAVMAAVFWAVNQTDLFSLNV